MRKDRFASAALLAFVAAFGALTMPREVYPGDPTAMREEARSIVLWQRLGIAPEIASRVGEPGQYFVPGPDGRWYSKYGSLNGALFALPLLAQAMVRGTLPPLGADGEPLFLNLFNLALALLLAALLFRLARPRARSPWTAALFVALCFYTGYLWNYLRAQGPELFQVVLFTALVERWRADREKRTARTTAAVWALFAALCLSKISYLALAPALVGFEWRKRGAKKALGWAAPGLGAAAVVLAGLHAIKFGSPFLIGYHAWRPDLHAFTGEWAQSLYGLILDAHWSIPLHFPVLFLAALGLRRAKDRELPAFALVCLGLIWLAVGGFVLWRGEYCYGPRFFLFALPALALPAVEGLETLRDGLKAPAGAMQATLAAVLFGFAFAQQRAIARFPFMAHQMLREPLHGRMSEPVAKLFFGRHQSAVLRDLEAAEGKAERLSWWPSVQALGPEAAKDYERRAAWLYERRGLR